MGYFLPALAPLGVQMAVNSCVPARLATYTSCLLDRVRLDVGGRRRGLGQQRAAARPQQPSDKSKSIHDQGVNGEKYSQLLAGSRRAPQVGPPFICGPEVANLAAIPYLCAPFGADCQPGRVSYFLFPKKIL